MFIHSPYNKKQD